MEMLWKFCYFKLFLAWIILLQRHVPVCLVLWLKCVLSDPPSFSSRLKAQFQLISFLTQTIRRKTFFDYKQIINIIQALVTAWKSQHSLTVNVAIM